jgi:hypothetical protein
MDKSKDGVGNGASSKLNANVPSNIYLLVSLFAEPIDTFSPL